MRFVFMICIGTDMDWLYTSSGFLVGVIVGITGVGGGSLMTPLLVLAFGVAPATAVGTDLLYAALTKLGGSWAHNRRGTVDWKIVRLLALGSVPAALLSLLLLKGLALDEKHMKALITSVLSVALVLTASALLLKPYLQKLSRRADGAATARQVAGVTILTGVVLGALVTLSSVGAGALGVVALLFLYPRLPTAKIVGTDIAHAVPLTLVAGLGHAALGTVDYGLLGSLLLGSLPGIWLGTHLGVKIPEKVLRPILASMLMIIGGRLLLA
jgi:uncharacterized membrane protein YfcA